MPTTLLTIGPVHTLNINQIYALPARRIAGYTDATASLEVSNDVATGFTPLDVSTGNFTSAAAFIRSTVGAPTIRLDAA